MNNLGDMYASYWYHYCPIVANSWHRFVSTVVFTKGEPQMTTKYIKTGITPHTAAKKWAEVNASDPFCYSRTKVELSLLCCSQGSVYEVQSDAERIAAARAKAG